MLKSDQRCVGIVSTDPLRLLGLEEIFTAHGFEEVISLSGNGALKSHQFPLIVIDAACTEHLFDLLATFRSARPKLKLIVIGLSEDFGYMERVIGAGAKGYLTHAARETEIHMAIDIVLDGSIWALAKFWRVCSIGRASAPKQLSPSRSLPGESSKYSGFWSKASPTARSRGCCGSTKEQSRLMLGDSCARSASPTEPRSAYRL